MLVLLYLVIHVYIHVYAPYHNSNSPHPLMLIDGAEMLLDLGLPAALIGGIVLPLLGAVPDSAMILASGVGGSRDDANKQIAVGMGYVTNLLLTQSA